MVHGECKKKLRKNFKKYCTKNKLSMPFSNVRSTLIHILFKYAWNIPQDSSYCLTESANKTKGLRSYAVSFMLIIGKLGNSQISEITIQQPMSQKRNHKRN